jgi:hypothetical protein
VASAQPATAGVVSGRLTEGAAPVARAAVAVVRAPYGVALWQTRTGADGTFRLDAVAPGTFALRFTLSGGLEQFHPGQADLAAARLFTVVAGAETVIDEAVMAHGSLAGRVTTDSGGAAAGAKVALHRTDGRPISSVLADADGNYAIPYPPTGRLIVAVAAAERGATNQWVPQRRTYTEAVPVDIVPGQWTTVDERLLPVGTIAGRFTRDGVPVANVVVYAYSQTSAAESVSNWTNADGVFRLRPYPGSYKLKFVVPAGTGLDQWAGRAESEAATLPVTVAADREVFLEERQLPTGRVSGRLVDAAGQPVAGHGVVISDPSRGRQFQATMDGNGEWFATVWPGRYSVLFSTTTQAQWAFGELSPQAADPVQVTAGGNTVVDDVLLRPGALTVTALDTRTGAAVPQFCVDANNRYVFLFACTDDGTVEFAEAGAGSYTVTVTAGAHRDSVTRGVRVVGERTTTHLARLRPT